MSFSRCNAQPLMQYKMDSAPFVSVNASATGMMDRMRPIFLISTQNTVMSSARQKHLNISTAYNFQTISLGVDRHGSQKESEKESS